MTEYERLVGQFNYHSATANVPTTFQHYRLGPAVSSGSFFLIPCGDMVGVASFWSTGATNRYGAMIDDSWCPIDKQFWVLGRYDATTLYSDEDLEKYRQNPTYLVEMVVNRLTENGLQPLTTDCRDHPRATEGLVTAQRLYFEMRRQSFDDGSQRAFYEAMQHVIDQEEQ